jgi:hypothetical protein
LCFVTMYESVRKLFVEADCGQPSCLEALVLRLNKAEAQEG